MDRKSGVEIWRDIEGYHDYQVSNLGRVKSLKYGKEKILRGCKDSDGYLLINLWKDGKKKSYKIHRLVASAFLDNPNNLPEVNHIDEDKTNNCVSNLEWCSGEYNFNYGTRIERITKANSIPIFQFTKQSEFIRKWGSTKDIERELGIAHSNISSCCKGKMKTCGGYKWGYAHEYERIQFNVFDIELYRKKVD